LEKLPKDLRLAIDPALLRGRRVETRSLLGHAARKIVAASAKLTGSSSEEICRKRGSAALVVELKPGSISTERPEQKDQAIESSPLN